MTFRLVSGDCLDALAEMPEASVDAVVTDPPYGLEFMGKDWDAPWKATGDVVKDPAEVGGFQDGNGGNPYSRSRIRYGAGNGFQQWTEAWAAELLRVLKPGGHLLAFGGTRTYHRLACGIEDAGFEVRDCLAWMYGSGFPKSLDVSKAIDKAAGALSHEGRDTLDDRTGTMTLRPHIKPSEYEPPAPATPAAQKWQGWGTALKPAFEPIILARKPLTGTVAANVQEYGTGALNIDGGRVAASGRPSVQSRSDQSLNAYGDGLNGSVDNGTTDLGRWPANVILDPEAGAMLDGQSGESVSTGGRIGKKETSGVNIAPAGQYQAGDPGYGDTGGASRFFYTAKASRAERNAGLDGFEERQTGSLNMRSEADGHAVRTGQVPQARANVHPTVKPIDLMRYLVRLVTPPGGTVLDPFTGSGTTGIAAGLEGFEFVGIEREAEYREIAEARLKWWADQEGETAEILRRAGLAEKERERAERVGQASLFEDAA